MLLRRPLSSSVCTPLQFRNCSLGQFSLNRLYKRSFSSVKPVANVKVLRPTRPFQYLSNPSIQIPAGSVRIKYATLGNPKNPAILIAPSMSNNVHVVDGEENGTNKPGWWRRVVGHGPEFGIDLDKFYVIVGAPMGSPFGSTSPLTPKDPNCSHDDDSQAGLGPDFPQITPLDQAAHQKMLLEELGIEKLFAVVGGSMGGMQALQFAATYPEMYDVFIAVASTAHTSPATVALRMVQRETVRMDPDFKGGHYTENPTAGLGVARMFGTICYRSPGEFDDRFDWQPTKLESGEPQFQVESYLKYQAHKFTTEVNYDANSYLLLSQSMDLMDIGQGVGGSFEEGVGRIPKDKQALLLSYNTDRLTPPKDLERLATVLGGNSVQTHFETLSSPFGHDAFLIESQAAALNIRFSTFLGAAKGGNVDAVRRMIKDLFDH